MEHRAIAAIRKTITEHALIEEGMQVVVGLSGGPDSTCLFHALASLRGELGFELSAAHVNHGLRPGAAEEDARLAEALCRARNAPFFGFERDVRALARARGIGEEEAGRATRYEAFREAAARIAAEKALPPARVRIAVAHNRNDQAETVLMRLIRGTGPDGLAAMPYLREGEAGFAVIRPLIDVPRALIEDCCAAAGLSPARDRSNEETAYLRNRLRLTLLPQLERDYNEGIVEALVRLAASAAEDRAYFDEITRALLEKGRVAADGAFEMPAALFSEARPALRRRLIVRCFERAGLMQDIAAVHLRAADALIKGGRTVGIIEFPNGYRLSLRYGRLAFFAAAELPARAALREQSLSFDMLLSDLDSIKKQGIDSGPAGTPADAPAAAAADPAGAPSSAAADRAFTIESGAYTIRFSLHTAAPAYAASADAPARDAGLLLDFDLLAAAQDGLAVRRRRAGDFMRPAGMNGTKRLQDLFVDAKLPREYRDAVPLIAAGKEILCILAAGRFARKTGNYAVTAATERVLRIVYAKRDDRRPGETEGESI